jgi:serine protease Do
MYDNENGNFNGGGENTENNAGAGRENTGAEINEGKSSYSYYDINSGQNRGSAYGKDTSGQNGFQGKPQPRKKQRGAGSKVAFVVVMALVAGIVAGSAFYGVNYIANRVIYDLSENAVANASYDDLSDIVEEIIQDSPSAGGSLQSTSDNTDGVFSGEMSVKEVASECLPSVVTIAAVSQQELSSIFGGTQIYESSSVGTGVIIGTNETELLIATNQHVTSGATSLSVGFIDETAMDAQIKGEDSVNDLAVVSVKLADIPQETKDQIKVAVIGNSDELELGEQVVAIGNSLGYGQSVTSGYISAKDRTINLSDGTHTYDATDLLQTDAAINAGNSGGPLFNMKGEVVGINEAKRFYDPNGETVEGMGYAIPISKAEPILEELMALETRDIVNEEDRGYLGVTLANVTQEVSEMYNMPVGACITEVMENSPAEAAGLQKGDVITEIDGRTVSNFDDLTERMEYYAKGETVDFVVMRADNGEYIEKTISVTLGDSAVLDDYYASQD